MARRTRYAALLLLVAVVGITAVAVLVRSGAERPVRAGDRLWHPGPAIQALANGPLPDSLVPGTFASIQRDDPDDVQVADNPGGLRLADGSLRKSIRLAANSSDTNVAGSTDERARAAVVSPFDLYGPGSHAFFGFGFYADTGFGDAGAIATWYGEPATGSGPMTIYAERDPGDETKAIVRMTRDPSRYRGSDPGDPAHVVHPWVQEVELGHTYAFVFDVRFSSRFDPENPYDSFGGSFKVWMSVDGGAYRVSPNVAGTARFSTQTFNEGVQRDMYFKGAQIYSADVGRTDTVVHFLPPAIGRTFDAADVLR